MMVAALKSLKRQNVNVLIAATSSEKAADSEGKRGSEGNKRGKQGVRQSRLELRTWLRTG